MKKALAMLLGLTLCIGLFAGCSNTQGGGSAAPSNEPAQTESQSPAATPEATPESEPLTGTVNTNGSERRRHCQLQPHGFRHRYPSHY